MSDNEKCAGKESDAERRPNGGVSEPVVVYIVRLSAPCRAVWLYLLQHDVPHELVDVDQDPVPDALTRLPHREVPILVDGDLVVFECPAILRYLATTYTQSSGLGSSLASKLMVDSLLCWANGELHRVVGYCYAYPSFLDKYRLENDAANESLIESGVRQLSTHLEHLEKTYLKKEKYLTGEKITVADSLVATVLIQAEWVEFKFKLWPRVEAWLRKVRAQDHWQEVHSVHNQLVAEVANAHFYTNTNSTS